MKKKNGLLAAMIGLVVVLGIVMTSCMSMMMSIGTSAAQKQYINYGVYDSSVSTDQLADFRFMFVNVKSFDGKPVNWKNNASGGNNMGHIKVPAGTHDIVFDWIAENSVTGSSREGNTITYTTITFTRSKKDIPLQVTFEAGHNYFLGGAQLADGRLKIHIIDQTSMPSEFYGDSVANPPKKSKIKTELEGTWDAVSDDQIFVFAGNTWVQTIPPNSATNEGNNEIQMRGTFEWVSDQSISQTLILYATDTRIGKGKWVSIKAMKQAYIYKSTYYSDEENLLDLELVGVLPEDTYIRRE